MATGNHAYGNASIGNYSSGNVSRDNYSTDNYTRNNRSYDNVTANRTQTSVFSDTGRITTALPSGSFATTNADGSTTFSAGSSKTDANTSLSVGESIVGTLRQSAGASMQRADEHRRSVSQGVSDVSSQLSGFSQAISNNTTYGQNQGTSSRSETSERLSDTIRSVDRFSEQNSISRSTAIELGVLASAGIGWGKLSAEARGSFQKRGIDEQSFTQLTEAAKESSLDKTVSNLNAAYMDLTKNELDALSLSADKGMRVSLDEVLRRENARSVSEGNAQTYAEAADRAESQFLNQGLDLSAAYSDFLLKEKEYSVTQAAEILANRREYAALNAQLREEFAQNYISDIVQPQIEPVFNAPIPDPAMPDQG